MTLDLAKLKEAAEKVRAARTALIADQDSQDAVNAYDQSVEDWCELANPSTILALIERLESAEGLLRDLKPHLDAIVCYASTIEEHEPNRIAVEVRAHMEKHK